MRVKRQLGKDTTQILENYYRGKNDSIWDGTPKGMRTCSLIVASLAA